MTQEKLKSPRLAEDDEAATPAKRSGANRSVEAGRHLRPATLRELIGSFDPNRLELEAFRMKRGEVVESLTYGQAVEQIRALGAVLGKMGIRKGDRLAILAENRLEWPITYLAATAMGAVAVPLDIFFTADEVTAVIGFCEPTVVFTSNKYLDKVAAAKPRAGTLRHIVALDERIPLLSVPEPPSDGAPANAGATELGTKQAALPVPFEAHEYVSFQALLAAGRVLLAAADDRLLCADVAPTDVASIVFLSTTLGVQETHQSILADVEGQLDLLGREETLEKRWLSMLPFHHSWPTHNGLVAPLLAYGTNTFLATTKFETLFAALRENGSHFVNMVPLLVERLFQTVHDHMNGKGVFAGLGLAAHAPPVERFGRAFQDAERKATIDAELAELGLAGLDCVLSAGAHLFGSTTAKMKMLGVDVCDVYGLTETGPVVTHADPRDNRIGSAGRVLPTAEVTIHEPDGSGNGEILARGPVLMAGYFKDPVKTNALFDDDGWLHTGDLGRFDEDGFLYVTGRIKNMVVTQGGKNVYPEEVEPALKKSRFIADAVLIPRCIREREFPYAFIQPDIDAIASLEKETRKRLSDADIESLVRTEIQNTAEIIAHHKLPEDFEVTFEDLDGAALRATVLRFDDLRSTDLSGPAMAGSLRPPSPHDASGVQETSLARAIATYMCRKIAEVLNLDASDIDLEMSFFGYLSSLNIVEVSALIEREVGIKLYPPMLFEHPNVLTLTRFFAKEFRSEIMAFLGEEVIAEDQPDTRSRALAAGARPRARAGAARAATAPAEDPIAIVGICGTFPGSPDVDAFWQHLQAGDDLITEIPADRFDWEEYFGDPWTEPNKMNTKWGGFVEDMDKFDSSFFGIPPKEARLMDPQQRVFLQCVWGALEDAGHKPTSLMDARVGLFAGVTCYDYTDVVRRNTDEAGVYTYTGTFPSVLPNRISYLLGIHGPSEVADTACSSALVAIHRARHAIANGECEMAIAGGVNALLTPELFISFSKSGMLSPDGRCKTFSKAANGYVRGEGAGVVVLKPLSKALADHDHVYAVIRASAVNHGGRASSFTSPNPNAQADLLVAAYRDGDVEPDSVSYIEAHGTGTSLGDPIEINGLKKAFSLLYELSERDPGAPNHCALGSVKTNIGHLESAAGIAGVIKVALAMKHQELPPSLHCDEVSPYVDLAESPFRLLDELEPWQRPTGVDGQEFLRRAGVSSFGVGGTNAHIVLEEFDPPNAPSDDDDELQVVVLSAKREERLVAHAQRLASYLEATSEATGRHRAGRGPLRLRDVAYTLQLGRDEMAERLALTAATVPDLCSKLTAFVADPAAPSGSVRGTVKRGKKLERLDEHDGPSVEAVSEAIIARDADALARLWTRGAAIDWERLHAGCSVRRVPLPAYPFLKKRCWVGETNR